MSAPFAQGHWEAPQGRRETSDLTLRHTAQRELREETGIFVHTNKLDKVGNFTVEGWRMTVYAVGVQATTLQPEKGSFNPEWFDLVDFFNMQNTGRVLEGNYKKAQEIWAEQQTIRRACHLGGGQNLSLFGGQVFR